MLFCCKAGQVLDNVEISGVESYNTRRFYFGIGEGTRDLPSGVALPLDSNAVFLNGGK